MDLECPYCEADLEVCHDDGFGYAEGVKHKMECNECKKSFVFETEISFYYEPFKADCLNEGDHKWKFVQHFPAYNSIIECQLCGERKSAAETNVSELKGDFVTPH